MTGAGWLGQPAAFAGGLLPPAVFPWVGLVIGLCIGSFLNVVIHRLPRMMERAWREECAELASAASGTPGSPPAEPQTYNLFVPRSRCPSCGKGITALQNIPLFSFVF